MSTENLTEQITGNEPKKSSNQKTLIVVVVLAAVLFMISQIVLNVTKQNGTSGNSLAAGIEQKDELIEKSMDEARQQLGDDFYKQASGGADVPQADSMTMDTQLPADNNAEAKPTTQPKEAPAKAAKPKAQQDEMVTVNLAANVGRANPFVPAASVGAYGALGLPELPKATQYPAPPTELIKNDSAIQLMKTTISGILYDAFSPSAIVNVEGEDHLVRKGDRINGYRIVNITKDRVIVQNGTNIYRATVGETLTTQSEDVTFNNVHNLQNKFGGASAPRGTRMIQIN